MSKQLARETAAQAWCKPQTENIEMNAILCEAFAEIIEEIWSQPLLGNATTRQLIDEITARISMDGMLDYRTIDGETYKKTNTNIKSRRK
jgi:hypothetical protein